MASSPSSPSLTGTAGRKRPSTMQQNFSSLQTRVLRPLMMPLDTDRKSMYHLDADTLDCPVCVEPLAPPVYQCENGHIVCGTCCEKLTKGCPSCSQPTGRIRCLAVEKILDSLQVACKYGHHGCKEMLRYNKKAEREEHEKETCKYKPIPCSVPYCSHEAPSFTLPEHLAKDHKVGRAQLNSATRTVNFFMSTSEQYMMVDIGDDGLLLVHREDKSFLGDVFWCTTISGPSRAYTLRIKRRSGSSFYILKTSAPNFFQRNVPKLCVSKEYLLVPILSGDNSSPSSPREFDLHLVIPLIDTLASSS